MTTFSILINTTDSFQDCWYPFFELFRKYWPDYGGKIYLNTEAKDFFYDNLNILPIKNGLAGGTWSQCLKYALDFIKEDHFLYMQEDYFLHSPVNNDLIQRIFKEFKNNNFDCLHLTDQCNNGPFEKKDEFDEIWEVKKGVQYRISTQAAFWRNSSLKKIVRSWESGWQFEKYGTKRSNYLLDKIMCVNQEKYQKDLDEILPYLFTGIIKGKWKKEVKDLFGKNSIEVNFSKRGFFDGEINTSFCKKISNRISKLPNNIMSLSDHYILKIKVISKGNLNVL